jgi:hypothetical protein
MGIVYNEKGANVTGGLPIIARTWSIISVFLS